MITQIKNINKDKNSESTISVVNPMNKQKQGKATISDNLWHDTSKANAINQEVEDDDNLGLMIMLTHII